MFHVRSANNGPAVQFPAGKMTIQPDGMAVADTRKGVLAVSVHSSTIEFVWTPDGSPDEAETTIIQRSTSTFEKVDKCKKGRVFALCVEGKRDKEHVRLWWLQTTDASSDAARLQRIQRLIGDTATTRRNNNNNTAMASTSSSTVHAPLRESDVQQALERARAVARSRGANTTTTTSSSQMRHLSLQRLIHLDSVRAAVQEDLPYYRQRLLPHLPACADATNIIGEIRNNQASSAAEVLEQAIMAPSGLNEICAQFQLPTTTPDSSSNASPTVQLLERIIAADSGKTTETSNNNNTTTPQKEEEAKKKEEEKKE